MACVLALLFQPDAPELDMERANRSSVASVVDNGVNTMAGENRTPDKAIGEIKHAQEQADRTTGHQPPHRAGAAREKEAVGAKPDQDPQKKKTGEF